ncbi:hypothetical protein [Jannaschia aquimarina]|uniref:Uncharacterized protein n=1 Tax=Jannaschia aquimarina TaxID=935700 RepID=A0A0D1CP89_9RHOB|nr:hypothetical protein [Jannaschia aquimarina]KIT16582.1 hypothetical protein jaqu_16770 [Jannaschia aquimarina]SNT41536.1 hypothetical protein SAMN05421775_11716 [Jannaschia aquimarina]
MEFPKLRQPKVMAEVAFTRDMVETLNTYFSAYQDDGVVTITVTDGGLYLENPTTASRQFLGLARLADDPKVRH